MLKITEQIKEIIVKAKNIKPWDFVKIGLSLSFKAIIHMILCDK
jgi:hypothetical protein